MAGGTGQTFDWNQVVGIAAKRRVVIAGGLCAENVGQCIERALRSA